MMSMMLADGFNEIQALIPFAIGILYVLGHVASVFKKKKEDGLAKPPTIRRPTPPAGPPRRPAPPRPPGAVQAPRPPRAPTPPPIQRPAPPTISRPPRPVPPQTTVARRPIPTSPRRPTPFPQRATPQPAARVQRPVPVLVDEQHEDHHARMKHLQALQSQIAQAGKRKVAKAKPAAKPQAQPGKRRRKPRSTREQLDRVLGSRSGLQAAILLSEILSAPVALRDDHLMQ